MVGIPTMGSIHPLLATVILMWQQEAFVNKDYSLSIYFSIGTSPVDQARNEIVDIFLQGDCTHLFFIDSDTIPPVDGLKKLLAHDKEIVSGITPIIEYNDITKEFYRVWNCWNYDDTRVKPNTGVHEIKGAGGSCILIKREVFESLEKPYYRFVYQDDTGKEVKQIGEDIRFTVNAIAKGYKPIADTSVICHHYKTTRW